MGQNQEHINSLNDRLNHMRFSLNRIIYINDKVIFAQLIHLMMYKENDYVIKKHSIRVEHIGRIITTVHIKRSEERTVQILHKKVTLNPISSNCFRN